jgi:2-oxoglutarate/2-oxoacid ferredoxin oxidoreductase subunit alpha
VRARGLSVAHLHLVHLNPLPSDLGDLVGAYRHVLIPEANLGQLSKIIRAEYLVEAMSLNKIQGVPFRAAEIEAAVLDLLGVDAAAAESREDVAS